MENSRKNQHNEDTVHLTQPIIGEKKDKYFCPMHCEGNKTYDKPGDCSKCGMDLKILKSDSTKQIATESYQCPMKCEGDKTYAAMKSCPACGMDLKALKAGKMDMKKAPVK